MLQRLKTSLPLLAIFLFAFFLPGLGGAIFFLVFASVMLAFACHESFSMLKLPSGGALRSLSIIAGLCLTISCACFPAGSLSGVHSAIIGVFILSIFGVAFVKGPSASQVHGVLTGLGVFLYLCWPLSFMPRIFFLDAAGSGRFLLFYLIVITKMADIGAYLIGTGTAKLPGGNHKLSPRLSPKKSWEGLLGGTIFSMLASLAFFLLVPERLMFAGREVINLPIALLLGFAVSIIGLLGDLAESSLKRAANAKDSGSLPGLGGVLDMVDSLIPIAPFFFAFLILSK